MSIFDTGIPLNKYTKVVPVFLTINSAYAPYAAAAIHSLTQHCNPQRYYKVIILHDGLNPISRIRLRSLVTKNVSLQFKKITHNLYLRAVIAYCAKRRKGAGDYFSSAVYYYRFFIPRLFPMYEKAVYIDSDVILRGDIGELFDLELSDTEAIAAMPDPKVTNIPEFRDYVDHAVGVPHEGYVNDGVMLMDLKKMRKMRYLSTMVGLIQEFNADLVAPDQDYVNVILQGKIKPIGAEWNAEPSKDLPEDTKLIHFNIFNKPWHYQEVPCGELFWHAAKGTGFYNDLRRQQADFDAEKQKADHEKVAALIAKAGRLAKVKKPLLKLSGARDWTRTSMP